MNKVRIDDVEVRLDLERKSRQEIVCDYAEIANKQGNDEQFYVCDIGDIVEKYKTWTRQLPRVKMFYAVKCNPDKVVMKVLADLGASFDCASKDEISKVLSLDVSPDSIIYTHTHKPVSSLKFCARQKVPVMTFDSEGELQKIKSHYPDAKLILRILPDQSFDHFEDFGNKFGCHTPQIRDILFLAKELQLNVIGVSFHVGSEMTNPLSYKAVLKQSKEVFEIASKVGYNMTILDIGGGFPGKQNEFALFKELSNVINETLDDLFPREDGVEVIAEPGRYVVASAYTAVVNTIGKRVVPKMYLLKENDEQNENSSTETEENIFMYYVYGTVFADFLFGPFARTGSMIYTPKFVKPVGSKKQHKSILWGFTCTAKDCINPSLVMPELDVGDWIYFEDMGAYTRCFSSNFNGFETPQIKYHCLADIWQKAYAHTQQEDREGLIQANI